MNTPKPTTESTAEKRRRRAIASRKRMIARGQKPLTDEQKKARPQ